MKAISRHARGGRRDLVPVLALLILAGCETDAAQLVQEIDAAREGCTDEMLEAGAEECVEMFEKYIEMGTGAIETYIGAMRAFDAAVDRGPTTRFDTTGIGHAISPELLDPAAGQEEALPLWDSSAPVARPSYQEELTGDAPATRTYGGYQPDYIEENGVPTRSTVVPAEAEAGSPPRRSPAPAARQTPGRGAILPPEERLQRPWIGDGSPQEDYYPNAVAPREELKRLPEEPKARRPHQSERAPL